MQRDNRDDGDRQHHQALGRDHRAEGMNVDRRHQRREWLRLRTIKVLDALLEQHRQRNRRNHQRQHAVAKHRIDNHELEQEPEHDDRRQNSDQGGEPERRSKIHRRQHEEGRQHDKFALGEIDGLRRLPQQREADGDQRIDRAGRQPGNQKLNKGRHRPPRAPFKVLAAAGAHAMAAHVAYGRPRPTCRASAAPRRSSACRRRPRRGSFRGRCRRYYRSSLPSARRARPSA